MFGNSEQIIWLASYPKSGNTWVRCLLQAYRNGGYVDINDLTTGIGDSSACYTRAAVPAPLEELGARGCWLVRPAALLNAMALIKPPRIFKTHYFNGVMPLLPAFIPPELTGKAIYIVRDPRDVVLSFAKYFRLDLDTAVATMANNEFQIAEFEDQDEIAQVTTVVSSWSNHVKSWASETKFPVHFVKYEDLVADTYAELVEMLNFLDEDPQPERVAMAVKAARLRNMQAQEAANGFVDHARHDNGTFFNKGGSRWKEELPQHLADRIVNDHEFVMQELGYAVE